MKRTLTPFLFFFLFSLHSVAQLNTFQMVSFGYGYDFKKASTVLTKFICVNGGKIGMYDADGNQVWVKGYGSSSMMLTSRSVTVAEHGDFIVRFYNTTNAQSILTRLDSSGNIIWSSADSPSGYTRSVVLPSNKNLVISVGSRIYINDSAGNWLLNKELYMYSHNYLDNTERDSSSIISVGNGSNPNNHTYDILVMAVSDTGKVLWEKSYDGTADESANTVIRTRDGNFLVTGYTKSHTAGDKNIFLLKLDSIGNVLWFKTYGTPGDDEGFAICENTDGTLLIGGNTNGFSNVNQRIAIKLDAAGDVLTSKIYREASFPTGVTLYAAYSDSNSYYLFGRKSNNTVYFHKTDSDLNGGCYEQSVNITQSYFNLQPYPVSSSFLWHPHVSSGITVPILSTTPIFSMLCSTSCGLDMSLNVNSTQLCPGDSLIAVYPHAYDSLSWFCDGVVVSQRDTFSTAQPSVGNHTVGLVVYSAGCVDSTSFIVHADTTPLLSFTVTNAELSLHLQNTSSNLSAFAWTVDSTIHLFEASAICDVNDFGSHLVCLSGSNFCGSDTACSVKIIHDSLNYSFFEKITYPSSTTSAGCIRALKDGGAIVGGSKSNANYLITTRFNTDGSVRWKHFYTVGTSVASINSINECYDHGFIMGGNDGVANLSHAYVMKLDSAGNISWTQYINVNQSGVNRVIQLHDSSLIATGYYGNVFFAERLNSIGNVIWMKKFSPFAFGSGITESHENDAILITGQDFTGDLFILKLDLDGNFIFDKNSSQNGTDYGLDIIQTRDGNYLALGSALGFDPTGGKDIILWKIDPNGNLIWSRRVGGDGDQSPSDVSEMSDGDILISGEEYQYFPKGVIVRTDSLGNLKWVRLLKTDNVSINQNESVVAHSIGNDDFIYTTGGYSSLGYAFFAKSGPDGLTGCNSRTWPWITAPISFPALTNLGMTISNVTSTILLSNTVTPTTTYSVQCISTSCNPQVLTDFFGTGVNTISFFAYCSSPATWTWLFGDSSSSTQQFPVHTYSQPGVYTVCVIYSTSCTTDTLCFPVNTAALETPVTAGENDFTISPNPACSVLHIEVGESFLNPRMQLTDISGRVIYSGHLGSNSTDFDINGLSSGIYCVMLEDDYGHVLQKKIVVSKN